MVAVAFAISGASATSGAPEILAVTPSAAGTHSETRVSITGTGFSPFADVSLLPGGLFQAAFRPTPYVAERIALYGDYALVTDWNRCITVFDVGDPWDPTEEGGTNPPGGCFDVDVESGHAYATSNSFARLYVMDLADPGNPAIVRQIETGIVKAVLAVQGDLLFVGGSGDYGGGKLQIYSLASLDDPILLTTKTFASNIDVMEIRGALLYVLFAQNLLVPDNFKVFDATIPGSLHELGSLRLGTSMGLYVEGNLAYVARGLDGMAIVDLSDPEAPNIVVEFDPSTSFYALDVVVKGNTAYVSGGPGLSLWDVKEPANPEPIASIQIPFGGRALEVVGNSAFVVAGGLAVVGVGNPESPDFFETGIPTVSGSTFDLLIKDVHAYAVELNHGLLTFDIRDPLAPLLVAVNGDPRQPRAVAEDDGRIFTSGWELSVFNLRPSDPRRIGSASSTVGLGVAVAGQLAFTVNDRFGLTVYDISQRSAPRQVGSRAGLGIAVDVAAADDLVFVAGGFAGLFVVDVSEPGFPTIIGNYDTFAAVAVAIAETYVLVADDVGGLLTFDISDPTHPVLANTYDTRGNAENVIVRGTTAYLSDSVDGIVQLDVSDPTTPVPRGIYGSESRGSRVDATATHLFRMGPELKVYRLNPQLTDIAVLSSTAIEFTVPEDFEPGPYHVRVTDRLTGVHSSLYNGISIDPRRVPGSAVVGTTDSP